MCHRFLSWLSELGHSKVIIQSDGEPASEIVMRMVQLKGAMMEHPPCEIIQQQSQRYSHQSNGGAERMVQTIRIRSKPTKSKSRRTQESPSKPIAHYSLGYHDTQHGNTRDSTKDKTRRQQHTRRFDTCLTKAQSCLLERQLRADDQEHWSTNWNPHCSKAFGSDVTAKQMSI